MKPKVGDAIIVSGTASRPPFDATVTKVIIDRFNIRARLPGGVYDETLYCDEYCVTRTFPLKGGAR